MGDAPKRIMHLHRRPDIGPFMSDPVEYVRADLYVTALAERDATIAALRAEVDRLTGGIAEMVERMHRVKAEQAEWLAKCLSAVETHEAEIARLRAGITAAVDGRYERQVSGLDARYCQHDVRLRHACADCLLAHLRALLDPQAPDAGEGQR